jgi:DNA helicase-2/ATP-dependent DNA helicase PcrA
MLRVGAKGITYKLPDCKKNNNKMKKRYYLTSGKYLYSNRITVLFEITKVMDDIKSRLKKYFDEFIIDEIQDLGGRDFTFLEKIVQTDINILLVGDYFQHTYDTSRDGQINRNLHKNIDKYKSRFSKMGLALDHDTLNRSYRCSPTVCQFISDNLQIPINSNRTDKTEVVFIDDEAQTGELIKDDGLVKLFYEGSHKYQCPARNWGDSKGEDRYEDICIVLNKTTIQKFIANKLYELAPATRNKLYVAITRARGNVYFVDGGLVRKLLF